MAARRRIKGNSSSASTDSSTGVTTASVAQLLSGQRNIAAAKRRAAAGAPVSRSRGASATSSAATAGAGKEPGKIVQQAGKWVMAGFEEDRKAMRSLVPALQQRLRSAVEAEQQQEAAAMRALYASSSLRKLERNGLVLLRLAAAPNSVLYSSMVWRFGPQPQQQPGARARELPYHRFRQGDSLLVSRFSDSEDMGSSIGSNGGSSNNGSSGGGGSVDLRPGAKGFRPLDATVLEVRKDHLLLALDKGDSDLLQEALRRAGSPAAASWRLDQSVRDTTARRQLEAVQRMGQPTSDSAFEALLRQVLACSPNAAFMTTIPPLWVRTGAWRLAVRDMLQSMERLNDSQKRAIVTAVTRSLTLWQGPPGTGKTRTLLSLVEVLVRTARKQPGSSPLGPILACADTNAAVDNLVQGLMHKGLRVVRLGQPAKVRNNLRHLTLEAQAEATPDGRRAAQLRQASKALFERAKQAADGKLLAWGSASRAGARSSSGAGAGGPGSRPGALGPPHGGGSGGSSGASGAVDSAATDAEARRKWAQAEQLTRAAAKQVLEAAEVVCATCAGAGDPLLSNRRFRMVVIDEATQATEPATLVPLTQGAECVVMAGDPAQLPPTITSREAALTFGLQTTLFERLQAQGGVDTLLLDTQYRMNPAISSFPSRWFYGGALLDGVTAADKPAAAGLRWPRPEQPVMVVAVQGLEERARKGGAAKGRGGGNGGGADLLLYGGGQAFDDAAGLMEASYRNLPEARVALQALHALITAGDIGTAAILTPYKGQVRALEHGLRTLSPWFGPDLLARVSVSSVDAYQGREADAVVFSAVRCNSRGRIGFVDDPRRLNVAITRPRRGLVVVCSPDTLQKGSRDWAAFLQACRQQGWVAGPQALPAAPWDLEDVDPFAAAPGEDGGGGIASSSYEEAGARSLAAGSGGRRRGS